MANPNFYAAVYAIIRDEAGKILFSQRKNTRFLDGKYQLPAGHMDGNETMTAAMARELKEELDIDAEDMNIVHISHRICADREYFDVYVEISAYSGMPRINEPDKCADLQYFGLEEIDDRFVKYDADVIAMIRKGVFSSEIHMDDYL